MTQVIRNQCPHCLAHLVQLKSIKTAIRGFGTYYLTPSGQLKAGEIIVTRQGSYRCAVCDYRLNKFLKEVKVGIMEGKKGAASANNPGSI